MASAGEPRTGARPRRRMGPVVFALVVLGLFGGGLANCGRVMGYMDGNSDEAIELLRACPRAVQALGDDIDIALGFGCGSGESDSFATNSDMSLPVAGNKARGRYRYLMVRSQLGNKYHGTLEVDGKPFAINPTSCAIDSAAKPGSGPVAQ